MNGIAIWEPKDLFESAKGSILISMQLELLKT
jgi:hypothetical protein